MAVTGTIVETLTTQPEGLKKLSLVFKTESGGTTVGEIPTTLFDGGEILRIAYIPTDVPALADVTILDVDGKDILMGKGANWGLTAKDMVPLMGDGSATWGHVFVLGALELTIAEGGDAKTGEVIIYWK